MKHVISLLALSLGALALAGCDQVTNEVSVDLPAEEGIATVANARLVMPTVTSNPAGVFFDLTNNRDTPLILEDVAIEGAGGAMIHDVTMEDGVASMFMIESAEIPAGETLAFAPGTQHVMAMKLEDSITAGDSVKVTLTFSGGDELTFDAEVQEFGQEQ